MKLKIFNTLLPVLAIMMVAGTTARAQQPVAPPAPGINLSVPDVKVNTNIHLDDLNLNLNEGLAKLNLDLNESLGKLNLDLQDMHLNLNNLELKLDSGLDFVSPDLNISPNVNLHLDDLKIDLSDLKNLNENLDLKIPAVNINVDPKVDFETDSASNDWQDVQGSERTKSYSKSYPADGNNKLQLNNKFGKITVNTWNKNEFKVDVQIKVATENDKDADKLIDAVSISDSKSGDVVSFTTNYDPNIANKTSHLWDDAFRGSKVRKLEINYTVYMPAKNALTVRNRYGSTELPDMEGKVSVDCAYGSLSTGVLSNADNDIHVRYGSANITGVNSSDVDMAYGSLEIGHADKLNASFRYGSAKIGKLTTMGNISVKYGGPLVIDDLDRNVKSLSVNCEYSGVKLGLSGDENADFDVTVKNGSFNYNDNVSVVSKNPPDTERGWRPTVNYKGKIGKGNGEKVINITSTFGSVHFD